MVELPDREYVGENENERKKVLGTS